MTAALTLVVLVIVLALVFDFTNGFHDTANAMATPIATGAMTPKVAVGVAAVLNLVGAFLSTEVARTVSGGLLTAEADGAGGVGPALILAGLMGAILWNLTTWYFGLPSSSSHALFGGLVGAAVVGAGLGAVDWSVLLGKVILPAVLAPLTAGFVAFTATRLAYRLTRRADGLPDGRKGFRVGQIFSSSALAIAAGTYSGGWRIIRTMGTGLTAVKPAQGFSAEVSTAATVLASSHVGFALSTTHVASGSVIGSGLGRRGATVRWGTARRIVSGWLLTLPAAAIVGALAALLVGLGPVGVAVVVLLGVGFMVAVFLRARPERVDASSLEAEVNAAGTAVARPGKKRRAR